MGFVPKTFGEAVELDGLVPVSNGEPNGLLLLDGVPVSKREEDPVLLPEGKVLPVPVPNDELAPAPASEDEEDDEELLPVVSSCAHSPGPLHNPPATNRAIQCR